MTDPARLAGVVESLRAGRFADAERDLGVLLSADPNDADVLQLLGVAANSQGRLEQGLAWFDRARSVRPASFALMQNRAHTLFLLGRLDEAREAVDAMARIDAAHPAVRDLLARLSHEEGVAHHTAGRFAPAIDAYRRAVALGLSLPQARLNLANALRHHAAELAQSGRLDEAIESVREALTLNPRDENALSDLGTFLLEKGDVAGARDAIESALRVKPDFALALNALGLVLREEGRQDEAARAFERALQAQPGYARPAYNLALARLTQRRFEEGWRLYEARFAGTPPQARWREFPVPRLAREDLGRGRRTAVWREQGIGDQILYATTLVDFASRGEAFALELDARLVPALRRSHPQWTVVTPEESDAQFARCDRHAPIADIAGFLRGDIASFDAQPRALLKADPARAAGYRATLRSSARRAIGISWRSFQGNRRARLEATKSAPLSAFAPLAARGDLRLVDLQYGDTAAERAAFEGGLVRIEDLDAFNDLDGLLAAIDACDAVVTTSSVTAHLAGAAGKETYLMYPAGVAPFHYWATDASGRCLWYPSIRIVTGAALDSWPRLIARVDELLGG